MYLSPKATTSVSGCEGCFTVSTTSATVCNVFYQLCLIALVEETLILVGI